MGLLGVVLSTPAAFLQSNAFLPSDNSLKLRMLWGCENEHSVLPAFTVAYGHFLSPSLMFSVSHGLVLIMV